MSEEGLLQVVEQRNSYLREPCVGGGSPAGGRAEE